MAWAKHLVCDLLKPSAIAFTASPLAPPIACHHSTRVAPAGAAALVAVGVGAGLVGATVAAGAAGGFVAAGAAGGCVAAGAGAAGALVGSTGFGAGVGVAAGPQAVKTSDRATSRLTAENIFFTVFPPCGNRVANSA